MKDWDEIRKDFPIVENITYFQSAGMSPIPVQVFETLVAAYREIKDFGDIFWEKDFDEFRGLCATIGEMLGTAAANISFVPNTSTAMAFLALSLQRQQQGQNFHIVSLMDEFPSSTVPLEYQNIPMMYVEPIAARYPTSAIVDAVDSHTLAVLVSYVQYSTGFRLDIGELGLELKKRGVLFLVNATQAFPLFPVNVQEMHIDALSASLHKWGCAGHVGAVLYTSPQFRQRYPLPMAGWLSLDTAREGAIHTAKNVPLKIRESAGQYHLGTINFQPLKGLIRSLQYLSEIGFARIEERIFGLADYLLSGLSRLKVQIVSPVADRRERSAIVAFRAGANTKSCISHLAGRKIHVSYRNGNIRVSLNIFNNHADIDRLLLVLEEFLEEG